MKYQAKSSVYVYYEQCTISNLRHRTKVAVTGTEDAGAMFLANTWTHGASPLTLILLHAGYIDFTGTRMFQDGLAFTFIFTVCLGPLLSLFTPTRCSLLKQLTHAVEPHHKPRNRHFKMGLFEQARNFASKFGFMANKGPQQPTQKGATPTEPPNWNALEKFTEEMAKRAGITQDELWNSTLSGRLP
jgi:hypothetical protein